MWLFVSINGIKIQFFGVVGFKSSTLTVYCLSSWFVHHQQKTYSPLCVLCWLSHISWFQWPKDIPPSFWLRVTNHDVTSKNLKKLFLRSSLFYTTFSWCWKVEEKTKNICEGHTKILVYTTCGLNVFKNPPESPKVATSVNFFNVEKTLACFPHQDFEMHFFQLCLTHMSTAVCPSARYTLSYQRKKKYFVQKSWWWKRQYLFLSEGLAV